MDIRRIALWMVGIGAAAMAGGLMADALEHADDETLRQREGILELSSLSHATFFAGVLLAILGVALLYLGPALYAPREGGPSGGRRVLQVLAPLAALMLVAGCTAAAGNSWLAEGTGETDDGNLHGEQMGTTGDEHADHDQTMTGDEHTHGDGATTDDASASDDHGHGVVIAGTATGDSPCELASPTPASPGQVGGGSAGSGGEADADSHGEVRGMVVQESLTRAEREQLQAQMAQAREAVAKYPTVADAEAAGYHKSTPYVPCIGAHYTNIGLVGKFDPAAPSEILYDGTDPDSKIVGLSYLVWHPEGAPEGFAGPNDHFHQHNANGGLCLKGGLVVAGEASTPEECAAAGGEKRVLEDIWMAHAWVVPGFECSWGVFAGECPELGGRVGGTAWDE